MMKKIRPWLEQLAKRFPALRKNTLSAAAGILPVLLPCAAVLFLLCFIEALGSRYEWLKGTGEFWALVEGILVMPLAAGMITYAASAVWEHRSASLNDAAQLVRIRIKPVLITGVAAGAIMLLLRWVSSVVGSVVGILPALTGWIPLVGPAISGIAGFVLWLLALALAFVAHAAMVSGMLALTADGMSGKPQLERAIGIVWEGRSETLPELGTVFGVWIILEALAGALGLIPGMIGALAGSLVSAALYVLSMTAVSVVYLTARDRKDGMRFHS